MKTCAQTYRCAMAQIVTGLNFHRDETREEQNDRSWRAIQASALRSGDDFGGYDGDLLSAA